MEIALIRHGRPGTWTGTGSADPALNATGITQSERLAQYLTSDGSPKIDAIYSSPMLRSKETANITARRVEKPVAIIEELAEYDYGLSTYVTNEEYEGDFQEYWDDITKGRYAGTQIDLKAFRKRVLQGLTQIISKHEPDSFIVIFCHGGVISASIAEIIGLESTIFVSPAYTSISRILRNPNGRNVLLSYNETPHLQFDAWATPGRII